MSADFFAPLPNAFLATALLPVGLLPAALLIDRLVGELPSRIHPVCMMGALANFMEAYWCRGANTIRMSLNGAFACILVVLPCTMLVWFLVWIAGVLGGNWGEWLMAVASVTICLAPRSLDEHARRVAIPLAKNDITSARQAVSMLVGRQTDTLDAHGVARACVESVAENLVDGVLSTLFWAGVGLCFFGYPEAAALAVLHRSVNMLDALWGKKNERYKRFGTCAARLDDLLNFIPARLSLPCIALAAYTLPKLNAKDSLQIGWQYRKAHASPNSAWSEAAFAGAMGLTLGGSVTYAGMSVDYPWIGEGTPNALPAHILLTIRLMWRTTLVFLVCISAIIIIF